MNKSKKFPTYPWNIPQSRGSFDIFAFWDTLGYVPGVWNGSFLEKKESSISTNNKQITVLLGASIFL